MSGGIELQPNNLILSLIRNSESAEQEILPDEFPAQTGDENGAVFFNLNWQNRQAENLRQALTRIFSEASTEPNPVWTDLITLAKEHEDFAEFRRQPEKFWQQVRQMSETQAAEINNIETQTTSRFDKFLAEMQAKKMSLREFVQTLPPNERAVFRAAHQLKEFFGTNIFNAAGATPTEAKQTRFGEALPDIQRAADVREGKLALPGSLPVAPRAVLLGGGVSGYQNFRGADNNALQNTANVPQTAPEIFTARGSANAAAENKAQAGASLQRDGGTIIGGALIGGAFAAADDYKNLEKIKSDNSRAAEEFSGAAGALASGATGAIFGAAVGKIVPGAETVVSGILGFVSSVAIGADVNQGLRWLGEGVHFAANGTGAVKEKQLTAGKSLTINANLQTAWA